MAILANRLYIATYKPLGRRQEVGYMYMSYSLSGIDVFVVENFINTPINDTPSTLLKSFRVMCHQLITF